MHCGNVIAEDGRAKTNGEFEPLEWNGHRTLAITITAL